MALREYIYSYDLPPGYLEGWPEGYNAESYADDYESQNGLGDWRNLIQEIDTDLAEDSVWRGEVGFPVDYFPIADSALELRNEPAAVKANYVTQTANIFRHPIRPEKNPAVCGTIYFISDKRVTHVRRK